MEIDNMDTNQTFSELHYTLVLKRFPEYYIFFIIIPSLLLTSLCIIGIFTPSSNIFERNERVTLGLTTLLSMAVILNIVADQMPKSSEGLPLLGYFILGQIGGCGLAIILSTIEILLHQRANTRAWNVPELLAKSVKIASLSLPSTDKEHTLNEDQKYLRIQRVKDIQNDNTKVEENSALLTGIVKEACKRLQRLSVMIERYIDAQEQKEIAERFWMQFFDCIDTVLLTAMLIVNSVLTFIMLR
uniref:Neurotransmitter-gated ion-channel transmembrane domain-containing protein n=1 Tax=Plectus sambesii TaxID=2011161 RepID=A0A914W2E2_9BILA